MSEEAKNSVYDDTSISSLKGADRVRLRPAVIFGSDELKGAFHTVNEIISNALDEARTGFGKLIKLYIGGSGELSVRDYGRGVPMGWNEREGRFNWDLIYNEMYAGGKYNTDDYTFSLGLNGLGATSVQYVSEYFNVISYKDGFAYSKSFVKGAPTADAMVTEPTSEPSGTYIKWKLDNEVFPDTKFTFQMFKDYCETQAHLNKVTFEIFYAPSGETITIEGLGLQEYFLSKIRVPVCAVFTDSKTAQGKDTRGKDYHVECEAIIALTEENTYPVKDFYHNTAKMQYGVHPTAVTDALADFFNAIAKSKGVQLLYVDYADYISVAISSYSNSDNISWANQTKDGVSNPYIYTSIYNTVLKKLQYEYNVHNKEMSSMIENVLNAAVARKYAKEEEQRMRQARKATSSKKKAQKLNDCRSKDVEQKELYIVEGDSAMGSCVSGRESSYQAILPVRGKTLNCLKASLEAILKNDIVTDIVGTVGTGVALGAKNSTFDLSKLQYGKIIFCTDADVDGFQIRVLLFTVFYRLMPELLEQGRVYIVESPLFEIETRQGSHFAFSPEEKDEKVKELRNQGVTVTGVSRSKGLGENDADMMWNTTMNPATRRLIQLKISHKDALSAGVISMLFGNDVNKERKDFIRESLGTVLEDEIDTALSLVSDLEIAGIAPIGEGSEGVE